MGTARSQRGLGGIEGAAQRTEILHDQASLLPGRRLSAPCHICPRALAEQKAPLILTSSPIISLQEVESGDRRPRAAISCGWRGPRPQSIGIRLRSLPRVSAIRKFLNVELCSRSSVWSCLRGEGVHAEIALRRLQTRSRQQVAYPQLSWVKRGKSRKIRVQARPASPSAAAGAQERLYS